MAEVGSGTVVISVDAELGWGYHDVSPPPTWLDSARDGWQRLVELCDEFGVPATWAVVGHLFLDSCDGVHSDHPLSPEEFAHERRVWASRPDLRFGHGLIESVRDARLDHEIGCHTFAHVEFNDPRVDRTVARAEIGRCVQLATDRGISLRSFVFPRNAVGHRDVLAEYGFTCYRGRRPGTENGSSRRPVRKATEGLTRVDAPPLVEPTVDEYGLVNVPASLYLFDFEGIARRIVENLRGDYVLRAAKAGIDAVIGSGRVLHLWLHPNNITADRDVRRLRAVLGYLEERRESTDLRVATMGELADAVRNPSFAV